MVEATPYPIRLSWEDNAGADGAQSMATGGERYSVVARCRFCVWQRVTNECGVDGWCRDSSRRGCICCSV